MPDYKYSIITSLSITHIHFITIMATTIAALKDSDWMPNSEGEKELKVALEKALVTSPASIVTKSPDARQNRFILQTKGYHGEIFRFPSLHDTHRD